MRNTANPSDQDLFFETLIGSYADTPQFITRSWLSERIETQLRDAGCRFLLLKGEPGVGKTAFMAWLARQHPDWPRYFIRRDSRTRLKSSDARSFLFAVGHQLAATKPSIFEPKRLEIVVKQRVSDLAAGGKAIGIKIEDLQVSPFYQTSLRVEQTVGTLGGDLEAVSAKRVVAEERFLEVENLQHLAILDPAQVLLNENPTAQIVVLLDALDELRYYEGGDSILQWLANCPELPPSLRFILTSRLDDSLLAVFKERQRPWLREVEIDQKSDEVQSDLRRYVFNIAGERPVKAALVSYRIDPAAFVAKTVKKASGNFQYLATLARGIDQALNAQDSDQLRRLLTLEEVPDGLEELYVFFLALIKNAVKDQVIEVSESSGSPYLPAWESLYHPLLGILAVAMQPLSLTQLMSFSEIRTKEHWIHGVLERLGQFLEQHDNRYSFYHATFQDFLTDPKTHTHPNYYFDPVEWHGKILKYYRGGAASWGEVNWHQFDEYGLLHLADHLAKAQHFEDLNELVETRSWFDAKRDFDPSLLAYVRDVEVALAQADLMQVSCLPVLAAHSLILATVRAVATQVPLAAIEAMTFLGEWEQASRYAEMITNPQGRLLAIKQITEILAQAGKAKETLAIASEALEFVLERDELVGRALQQPARDVDDSIRILSERNRTQPTTAYYDSLKPYLRDETLGEEIRKLNIEFIALFPPTREINLQSWGRVLAPMKEAFMKRVDFPRDGKITSEESETLRILGMLPDDSARAAIDHDLVRGILAEILAWAARTDVALTLVGLVNRPLLRFQVMSIAAQEFARTGMATRVHALWTDLAGLDGERYAGARAERIEILTRVAQALKKVGDADLFREAMAKAMYGIAEHGLYDALSSKQDNPEELLNRMARRRHLEETADNFIQTEPHDQARALCVLAQAIFQDNHPNTAHRMLERAIEAASDDMPDQSRVKCLCFVSTTLAIFGDRERALEFLQEAIIIGERIEPKAFRAEALGTIARTMAQIKEMMRARQILQQSLLAAEEVPDEYGHDLFLRAWADALVRNGYVEEAIQLANEVKSVSARADVISTVALALVRAQARAAQRAEQILGQMALDADGIELEARVSILSRVAAMRILVEDAIQNSPTLSRKLSLWWRRILNRGSARAVTTLKEAVNVAISVGRESERIENLVIIIETLVREKLSEHAFSICEQTTDVPTRAVLLSAMLRALGQTKQDDEELFQRVNDKLANLLTNIDASLYHHSLSFLMAEQALRSSASTEEITTPLGTSPVVDQIEAAGVYSLSNIANRDGEIGAFRALNLMRIAVGLKEFPPNTLSQVSGTVLDTWRWFKAQASKPTGGETSIPRLSKALESARNESPREVWNQLVEFAPFVLESGMMSETWERLQRVETLFRGA